jgi:hypothetical protein
MPGHYTDWKPVNVLIHTLPEAYVQSNTGSSLHFAAPDGHSLRTGAAT